MAKKKSKKKHHKSKQQKAAAKKKLVRNSDRKQGAGIAKSKPKKISEKQVTSTVNASRSLSRTTLGILVVASIVLLILIAVLISSIDTARNEAVNTGQDQLLQVQPGNSDSLQPAGSVFNPQQSQPSPQGSPDDAGQIQPQSPVTPEQQQQIQQ